MDTTPISPRPQRHLSCICLAAVLLVVVMFPAWSAAATEQSPENPDPTSVTREDLYRLERDLAKEYYGRRYETLAKVVALGLTTLGMLFAVFSFLGIKSIATLRSEYRKALKRLRATTTKLRQLENEVLTVDDIVPNEPDNLQGTLAPLPDKKVELSELENQLLAFLGRYPRWNFNAPRIKNWGSRQAGFEQLRQYDNQTIEETLRGLVRKNLVRQQRSSKGHPIFGIAR